MALVVFTGGARSGKSSAAEKLARTRITAGTPATYVAFARLGLQDPELAERVARHRADRGDAFQTVEASDALSWREQVPVEGVCLVDCLGTLLGRAMEDAWVRSANGELGDAPAEALPEGFEDLVARSLDEVVEWLASREADTIVVTNEVGDGVVPAYASGRLFRDLLGRANRRLVAQSADAYLCVAGRLLALSALPREAAWPED